MSGIIYDNVEWTRSPLFQEFTRALYRCTGYIGIWKIGLYIMDTKCSFAAASIPDKRKLHNPNVIPISAPKTLRPGLVVRVLIMSRSYHNNPRNAFCVNFRGGSALWSGTNGSSFYTKLKYNFTLCQNITELKNIRELIFTDRRWVRGLSTRSLQIRKLHNLVLFGEANLYILSKRTV